MFTRHFFNSSIDHRNQRIKKQMCFHMLFSWPTQNLFYRLNFRSSSSAPSRSLHLRFVESFADIVRCVNLFIYLLTLLKG